VSGQHLSCLAGAAIASVHRAAHHTAEPASAQHSGHFSKRASGEAGQDAAARGMMPPSSAPAERSQEAAARLAGQSGQETAASAQGIPVCLARQLASVCSVRKHSTLYASRPNGGTDAFKFWAGSWLGQAGSRRACAGALLCDPSCSVHMKRDRLLATCTVNIVVCRCGHPTCRV